MSYRLKKLDQYILKQILAPIVFSVFLFSFLFLIEYLVQKMDQIFTQHISIVLIIKMLSYQLPQILVITIPMGVLMGTMLAIGRLSGNSEITAIKAIGISITRILRTVLLLGIVITVFVLLLQQVIIPNSRAKTINVMKQMIFSQPAVKIHAKKFLTGVPGFTIYVNSKNQSKKTAENVFIFQSNGNVFPTVTIAKSLSWEKGEIKIQNGKFVQLNNNGSTYMNGTYKNQIIPSKSFLVNLSSIEISDPSLQSLTVLQKNITKAIETKSSPITFQVILQQKISIAFASIILIFLGTLLAMVNSRSGKSASFGISLIIIFVYIALLNFCSMLALNDVLPAYILLWIPNLLLLLLAMLIYLKKIRGV